MSIHPNVTPLSFLLGTWQGEGRGSYPTIADFSYHETLTFRYITEKPFICYQQETASPDGVPMHTESGFLRPTGEGNVEFVIAQPTGQAELLHGTLVISEEGSVALSFPHSAVVNSDTAKRVDATARCYVISADGTTLKSRFDMAAVGQEIQNHLVSQLQKQL